MELTVDIVPATSSENGQEMKNGHEKHVSTPASFEEAIAATGFGKFNILLLAASIFPALAQVCEVMAITYVLPIAQCDLNLTLEDKGLLNGITHAGMIASGFIWGYLSDTFGRRKIILCGYFLNSFFALFLSFSPNKGTMIALKFITGSIINGPFAAAASLLTEFHSTKARAKVQLFRGMVLSTGTTVLPLLAWGLLPNPKEYLLFGSVIHSWNVFLLVCTIPAFISGVLYLLVPESPKFLMAKGNNEEALKVFQKVFTVNTGQYATEYPVKVLIQENGDFSQRHKTTKESLKYSFNQTKKLIHRPFFGGMIIMCTTTLLLDMSVNTIKYWLPQIFQAITDYRYYHNSTIDVNLCVTLEELAPTHIHANNCTVNLNNFPVYTNSIIVGVVKVVAFFAAGAVIGLLGTKNLLILLCFLSGCFSCALHLASHLAIVTTIASLSISFGNVGDNILTTMTLEMFPTNLRAMTLSIHYMFGRLGTIFGNVLFPIMLSLGCRLSFYFTGSLAVGCALLSILYPKVDNKPLV